MLTKLCELMIQDVLVKKLCEKQPFLFLKFNDLYIESISNLQLLKF